MLGAVMVAIGLVGVVMPAVPGHVLILAGLIVAAWADGFTHISPWTLGVIGVVALASYAVDFVSAAISARRDAQGSRRRSDSQSARR